MNHDELKKMDGRVVRIRPAARQFGWDGADLGEVDHRWRVTVTGSDSLELEYVIPSLGLPEPELLTVRLNHDHIKSYQSDPTSRNDGFLLLVSEVQIQFNGPRSRSRKRVVTVEPIHPLPKVGTRRPGPTATYRLVDARVKARNDAFNTEMMKPRPRGAAKPSTDELLPGMSPGDTSSGMTLSGVRDLVGESDYAKVKRLANEHVPHVVVTLQWQAPMNWDLAAGLRNLIGTIFGLDEIDGTPVQRLHADDVERRYRGALSAMKDSKFLLWLDHGYMSKVVGRPSPGVERIESDNKYHLHFRVRPEGKPVGVD